MKNIANIKANLLFYKSKSYNMTQITDITGQTFPVVNLERAIEMAESVADSNIVMNGAITIGQYNKHLLDQLYPAYAETLTERKIAVSVSGKEGDINNYIIKYWLSNNMPLPADDAEYVHFRITYFSEKEGDIITQDKDGIEVCGWWERV